MVLNWLSVLSYSGYWNDAHLIWGFYLLASHENLWTFSSFISYPHSLFLFSLSFALCLFFPHQFATILLQKPTLLNETSAFKLFANLLFINFFIFATKLFRLTVKLRRWKKQRNNTSNGKYIILQFEAAFESPRVKDTGASHPNQCYNFVIWY